MRFSKLNARSLIVFLASGVHLAIPSSASSQATNRDAPVEPTPDQKPADARLTKVQLRGRNITDDWVVLVRQMQANHAAVPLTETKASGGDGLCQIYVSKLGLPGCSDTMLSLAKSFNPDIQDKLTTGQTVKMPDLPLHPTQWTVVLDRESGVDAPLLADFETRWAGSIKSRDQWGTQTRLVLKAYDIYVPTAAPEDSPNLPVKPAFDKGAANLPPVAKRLVTPPGPVFQEKHFNIPTPQAHLSACSKPGYKRHDPASYSMLLDEPTMPACARHCVDKERCPKINLLDGKVFRHRDISSAIEGGDGVADDLPELKTTTESALCDVVDYDERYHATMLASVMVGQENSISQFIGLSNAKLYPWDTSKIETEGKWSKVLEAISGEGWKRPQIFVFAGQFFTKSTERYPDGDMRLSDPSEVGTITGNKLIWVTAAGQGQGDPPRGKQLAKVLPDSPMNLGDRQTIIVVTSCETCTGQGAHLWAGANYSTPEEGLVNLAAPGGREGSKIPAAADADHYSEAMGTSMATAFVGGLVGATLSCYPDLAKKPQWLKTRLEVTSTPLPQISDARKVTGGIVNLQRALLDPDFDWVDRGKGFEKLYDAHWCDSSFSLYDGDPDGDISTVSAKHIGAIKRLDKADPPRWQIANADSDKATNHWTPPGIWQNPSSPILTGLLGEGSSKRRVMLTGPDLISFVPNVRFNSLKTATCPR